MAHQLSDLHNVHACIGEARPKRVTQIVKGEIEYSRVSTGRLEAVLNVR